MHAIGMINYTPYKTKAVKSYSANSSHWIRAPYSGILVARKHLGQMVKKNEVIATVTDPFGEHCFPVAAAHSGIVIGMSKIPLVNEGDAVFHIATFENSRAVKHSVAEYQDNMTDIESDTYVR
jgi:predicted deacylase